ncbi:hypothetical protein [Helicobacter canis]|uniref:hypothetical protein n=1 Tax=Helicobacter canis TaxID=29419 RepID=UPI0015F0009B|nr:hypothetical protein [Helicobacter canis]
MWITKETSLRLFCHALPSGKARNDRKMGVFKKNRRCIKADSSPNDSKNCGIASLVF